MKSILKNMLVGVLLITGTAKPVATLQQVKDALKSLFPDDGKIVDTTLKNNIGNLNISYPFWLIPQINKVLQRGTSTDKCTVWNGFGGTLPYVRTITCDHATNTAVKLLTVTEDGSIICGIEITIKDNEYTFKYLDVTQTSAFLNKSCVQEERGFSVYQLPLKWILGIGGTALALYGGYRLLNWHTNNAVITALKAAGIDPEAMAEKAAGQVTPGQAVGVLAGKAGDVLGGAAQGLKKVFTAAP